MWGCRVLKADEKSANKSKKAETVAVITPQKIKPYTLFYPLFNQESCTEISSEILELSFASVFRTGSTTYNKVTANIQGQVKTEKKD